MSELTPEAVEFYRSEFGDIDDKRVLKLLHKYAGKAVKEFYQYDVFARCGDDGDGDGDHMCMGSVTELMQGATVRVLIPQDVSYHDVVRGLRKILGWIEDDADAAWRLALSQRWPSRGTSVVTGDDTIPF